MTSLDDITLLPAEWRRRGDRCRWNSSPDRLSSCCCHQSCVSQLHPRWRPLLHPLHLGSPPDLRRGGKLSGSGWAGTRGGAGLGP